MAQSSDTYHEPYELLSDTTRNMHRAVVSAMEELEAIDWYQQRAEACTDDELRDILLHNKDEEVEHALMTLAWIRRNNAKFAEMAELYLFAEGPILAVEDETSGDASHGRDEAGDDGAIGLGIGSLKGVA